MPGLHLLPREQKFYELFVRSSQNIVSGAELLLDMVKDYQNLPEKVQRIIACENYGDDITHELVRQTHRTFVTPLDREDIVVLAQRLDDIMDLIEEAARDMVDYRVEAPTQKCVELAENLVGATKLVDEAMGLLARHKLNALLDYGIRIHSLENKADHLYREAMVELFSNSIDLAEAMKWREVYLNLENATDRCEDVANVLEGIVLKYA